MVVLEARKLGKVYAAEDDEALRVVALRDINLTVNQGEFISIIGPSGCGKSTLFSLIGGLNNHTTGEILIHGERINGPHRAIGMVFQEDSTFPWLTSLENVEFGLKMAGMGKKERRERARKMIELVGLAGFENHYPGELSGGMRQRVAIGRTLVMDPEMLLMDEPFGALDEQTRVLLGEELLRICDRIEATVLFITHSISEAVMLSGRVYVMSARPGTFKKCINIDIPRPRNSSIIGLPRFGEIVEEIWRDLKPERDQAVLVASG